MKKLLVLFVFIFGISLYAQVIQNKDSLLSLVPNFKGDEKSKAFVELAKYHQYIEADSSKALDYAEQAINAAQTQLYKGIAFYRKALVYRSWEDDFNQLKYFDKALEFLQGENDSIYADVVYYKSRVYQRKGMYPDALRLGLQELKLREKLPSKEKLITALQEIGFTYDRMGDYNKAIEWHKKSLKEALQLNDDEIIGRSYGLIGIAYDELGDYEKALEYNFKAVDFFQKAQSRYLRVWYSNIGNTLTKKGDLKNAEKYTLMAINSPGGNTNYVTRVNLGKIYLEQNKFVEAEEVLQKVLQELIEADDKRILSEAYYRLHELRKKQGNFKEALVYFEKYKTNEDEMLSEAKSKQINEMSIQYETHEKERALAKEKIKVAENELKIKNKNNLLLILGIVIISIAFISLLYITNQKYKNKQLQKEKELSEAMLKIETNNRLQEQRLAISRDLHDNIGAQLTFIISSIDSLKMFLAQKEDKVANKLTQISQFTKETITELRDTIWAMNKEKISVEDLKIRISNFIEQAKISLQGIQFNFTCNVPKETAFTSKDGMNIYRIIQEAVNNAIKHANGEKIDVAFVVDENSNFEVTIMDNGLGFQEDNNQFGNGLNSIRKRASELNGAIDINSSNEGTIIKLTFNK